MKMVHHVIKIVVTNVRFLKTSFLGKVKKKKMVALSLFSKFWGVVFLVQVIYI